MLNPVIYSREFSFKEEQEVARKYFPVYNYITEIPKDSLVIPRYSFLPFGRDLERDIKNLGSILINSYKEHEYVADIQNWYSDLEGETPQTWFSVEEIPFSEEGPFVVKGKTNSRKHDWSTKMFASSKVLLGETIRNLLDDPFISAQGICIRKYWPFKTYMTGLNGLPITEEYRCFVLDGELLACDFYWQNYEEELKEKNIWPKPNTKTLKLIKSYIKKLNSKLNGKIRFYVIDIARLCFNNPDYGECLCVVELNDGTMSGLSCIDPDLFYSTLKERLNA